MVPNQTRYGLGQTGMKHTVKTIINLLHRLKIIISLDVFTVAENEIPNTPGSLMFTKSINILFYLLDIDQPTC